jgi:hypothetical protein
VAKLVAHGPLAEVARSSLNPDSLLDLSCHDRLIPEVDAAVAIKLAGAAGGVGLPAHASPVTTRKARLNPRNLFTTRLMSRRWDFSICTVLFVILLFINDNVFLSCFKASSWV